MTKYLHTMIRVTDPEATIRFFELIGLKETKRIESEQGRFTLIFMAGDGASKVTGTVRGTLRAARDMARLLA